MGAIICFLFLLLLPLHLLFLLLLLLPLLPLLLSREEIESGEKATGSFLLQKVRANKAATAAPSQYLEAALGLLSRPVSGRQWLRGWTAEPAPRPAGGSMIRGTLRTGTKPGVCH